MSRQLECRAKIVYAIETAPGQKVDTVITAVASLKSSAGQLDQCHISRQLAMI